MPLRDQFHLAHDEAQWPALHSAWATYLVRRLNRDVLGDRYRAEANVRPGGAIEVDVGTLEVSAGSGGTAVATSPQAGLWTIPAVDVTIESTFPDEVEIRILDLERGADLVGTIELVSPGNKDRAVARRAFVSKCAAYLYAGIGLVIVDVVTSRHHHLHDELVEWMGHDEAAFLEECWLYTTAYRPQRVGHDPPDGRIDIWRQSLRLGQPLPVMPLALRNGPTFPLELELAYEEACIDNRL